MAVRSFLRDLNLHFDGSGLLAVRMVRASQYLDDEGRVVMSGDSDVQAIGTEDPVVAGLLGEALTGALNAVKLLTGQLQNLEREREELARKLQEVSR